MTVTRLKRKKLRIKVRGRLRKQLLKMGSDQSPGDKSKKQSKQLGINRKVIEELKKETV